MLAVTQAGSGPKKVSKGKIRRKKGQTRGLEELAGVEMITIWSPVRIACKSRFISSFETVRHSQLCSYGLPGLSYESPGSPTLCIVFGCSITLAETVI